ncbi:unnamed protein product [Notodromas monacha]|uniref:Dipeptidyl aminopeptidase-like protein 6 n=1 Tax=Notodromas monacha TaxID=399045 RepID=A0A7R9BUE1_9CRUS|nr:unnamed protein product [Notodromas monacha]CAG0921936.1 unnamed protein product [Notodromas monacha]
MISSSGGRAARSPTKFRGGSAELASGNPEQRNWKGIFISVFVIAAFCGLILLAVMLVSPDTFKDGDTTRAIPLDDLLSTRQFHPRRFNGTWISDFEFVYVSEAGGVHLFNADNQSFSEILDASTVVSVFS